MSIFYFMLLITINFLRLTSLDLANAKFNKTFLNLGNALRHGLAALRFFPSTVFQNFLFFRNIFNVTSTFNFETS